MSLGKQMRQENICIDESYRQLEKRESLAIFLQHTLAVFGPNKDSYHDIHQMQERFSWEINRVWLNPPLLGGVRQILTPPQWCNQKGRANIQDQRKYYLFVMATMKYISNNFKCA